MVLIFCCSKLFQEKLYGKSVIVADREMVEEKADSFLSQACHSDVAFLVVGDPFGCVCYLSPILLNLIICDEECYCGCFKYDACLSQFN